MLKGISRAWKKTTDTALLAVSPRRFYLRQHFRRLENDYEYKTLYFAGLRMRGYRAARSDSGRAPWLGGSQSADQEILTDLPAMRNRSRELNRDDSLASGITNTFANNVIGTGMVPQARTGDPDKNKRMEAYWWLRANSLSPTDDLAHGQAQRLLFRKMFEDGDVFRKAVFLPDLPVWFEIIEADRVGTPPEQTANLNIRNGVERDGAGRPIAYWINRFHPGDGIQASIGNNYKRIDARYVRHLKIVDRPGQTRGVPACHAILQDLRDLDLLLLASLKRTQIAACLAAFIKSDAQSTDMAEMTAEKYGYVLDQAIEPGMLFKLYPNESVETLVPNFPTPELGPFIVILCRRIGAALGVCWQTVLRDFSQSTYSSARTDMLADRQTYRALQSFFIEKLLTWEWATVMQDGILRGEPLLAGITDADIAGNTWVPNGWEWVDPEKEASAAEIQLRIGSTTLRDICAAKGEDWEEIQEQRLFEEARETRRRIELGLPPPNTVALPAASPASNNSDANSNGNGNASRRLTYG